MRYSIIHPPSIGEEATPNDQSSARQSLLHLPARQLSTATDCVTEINNGSSAGNIGKASLARDKAGGVVRPNEPARANTPKQKDGSTVATTGLVQDLLDFNENISEEGSVLPKPPQMQHSHRQRQDISENHISRVPLKPMQNRFQAPKRQRAPDKDPSAKHQEYLLGGKTGVQLSEDDLFELLITKMRQREESEQAATIIQRQMKNENMGLKEQNLALQSRLKKCQGELVKTSSESRAQRAQIDKWKAKLGTFKGILNELGREYVTVREQANELKDATVCLEREKSEIRQTLDEIGLQVSNNVEKIQSQRDELSNSEGTIASLREALDHSEKRGELIRAQLSNEKKRIVTLETYIQNESQSQGRYLVLVKNDQRKMAEKIDSACELFNTSCSKVQDNILSNLGPALEHCVSSVDKLKEQFVAETMNVQNFTSSVEEATSR